MLPLYLVFGYIKSSLLMKKNFLLTAFVLAKLILQYLVINPAYELQRDEYLHLDQGNHLAWGYISVPPVTSWIAYLIKLLGNGEFWVKFFPALFGALTITVVWKAIEALKGGMFALVAGATALLLSVFLRLNTLFQPNTLDVFFWTLSYFTIIKYITTERTQWLYATAIAAAFGLLSKYNIVFLFAGMLPAVLLTQHRRVFASRHFYIACFIAVAIVSPNILWQVRLHFPTVRQLQELNDTQLVHVNRFDFVKDQLMFCLTFLPIIIAAFIAFFANADFKKYRVFFWAYLFSVCLFIFLKAKNYYALGLYPILIAFGAVYLEQLLSTGWKKCLRLAVAAWLIVFAIPLFKYSLPIQSPQQIVRDNRKFKSLGMLRWEDGKDHELPQDYADMVGWRELAAKTDAAYEQAAKHGNTMVVCDNYGEAGAINYYSRFPHINAVSFNADYINWLPLDKPIVNAIMVKEYYDEDSARTKERPLFDTVRLAGELTNRFAREKGTRIYLLKGAKADINKRLADERKERMMK